MASPVIQFKRGAFANLPGLQAGEPALTTDTFELYVGINSTTGGNKFFGSHRYWTREGATTGSSVNLVEGSSNGSNYVALKSPDSLAANVTYTLPGSDGTNGQVLVTNGSGTLSFTTLSSSLSLAGDSGTDTLTVGTDTLTFTGGTGIEATVTNNQVSYGLDAQLVDIAGLTPSDGGIIIGDGTNFVVESGATARASLGVDAAGTDNSTDVTLAGQNYLSLSNQQITAAQINLASHVTGSLPNANLANSTITVSDGSNSTATALGGTITFSATANETTVVESSGTVTIGLPNDVTISNDLTVTGNLIVNGSTTQVNTTTTTVDDTLFDLGTVSGSAPSSDLNKDIGILFNYYSGSAKKAAVYWDDSVSRIAVGADVSESSSVLTATTYAALEIGGLWVNDCAGQSQVISCSGSTRSLQNIVVDGGTF